MFWLNYSRVEGGLMAGKSYVIGVIDNPFEDDTMQERAVFGIFEEGQTTLEIDEQEEGGQTSETD